MVVDGEPVSLEELIEQMTEIENLTVAMGSALENHSELEERRKQQQQRLKRQQQQQRHYRLSYIQLGFTILNFLVVHLG